MADLGWNPVDSRDTVELTMPPLDLMEALLQAEVRQVIDGGDAPTRKALLASMVEEIRVVRRAEIFPSFSLPAVRHRNEQYPNGTQDETRGAGQG